MLHCGDVTSCMSLNVLMKLQPHVPVNGICMYLSHFGMLSTNSDSQEHHGVNPEFHPQQWFHSRRHILTGFSSMPLVRQWDSENGWFYTTCHVYNMALHVPFFWKSCSPESPEYSVRPFAEARLKRWAWALCGAVRHDLPGGNWEREKALVAGSLCYICVCTCCMFIAYIVHSWFTLVIAGFVL